MFYSGEKLNLSFLFASLYKIDQVFKQEKWALYLKYTNFMQTKVYYLTTLSVFKFFSLYRCLVFSLVLYICLKASSFIFSVFLRHFLQKIRTVQENSEAFLDLHSKNKFSVRINWRIFKFAYKQ